MAIDKIPSAGIDSGGVAPSNLSTGAPSWDASGNVGIGTSSPGSKLHVAGQIEVTTDTTTPTAGSAYFYKSSVGATVSGYTTVFETGGAGSRAERARIDSSGNLLVGRTSGLGSGRFVVESNAATINPAVISNTNSGGSGDYSIIFYRNGSIVGSVQTTLSATQFVTSSDYRLKHEIQPMTGALAKVAALKPVTYKWNADNSESQGFIAHELQAVVPDCVTGEKDAVDENGNPVYQGIDTSFLVATLTAAIQELKAEVDALRAQVEAR